MMFDILEEVVINCLHLICQQPLTYHKMRARIKHPRQGWQEGAKGKLVCRVSQRGGGRRWECEKFNR